MPVGKSARHDGVRRPYLQALFATAGYDPLAAADNRL